MRGNGHLAAIVYSVSCNGIVIEYFYGSSITLFYYVSVFACLFARASLLAGEVASLAFFHFLSHNMIIFVELILLGIIRDEFNNIK